MKNKIYLLGIILIILFTLGAVFKIMHWPGAGIALVVSLTLFSFVFTPLAIIDCYKQEKKYAFVYVAGLITIIFNFVGAMFKIMHWPGAGILLTIAIIIPFVLFLPAYLVYLNKTAEKSMKNLISVLFILVYVASMSALLAINVSKVVLDDSTLINNHYTLLAAYYDNSTNYNVSNADSANMEQLNLLSDKTDHLIDDIYDLKKELIIAVSDNNTDVINDTDGINIWNIRGKDNRNVSAEIMLNENKAQKLRVSINEYKNFLLEFAESENTELINKYLSTNDIGWEDEIYTWEEVHFRGAILIWTINYLTSLEFKVKMVEAELVESLTNS